MIAGDSKNRVDNHDLSMEIDSENKRWKCSSGKHNFKWSTDNTFYYYKIQRDWNIFCSICKENSFSKPSWHCRECNEDVCEKCGEEFFEILGIQKLKCRKNHDLQFAPDTCAYNKEVLKTVYHFKCNIFEYYKFWLFITIWNWRDPSARGGLEGRNLKAETRRLNK